MKRLHRRLVLSCPDAEKLVAILFQSACILAVAGASSK
jgi:hypothetical protein